MYLKKIIPELGKPSMSFKYNVGLKILEKLERNKQAPLR
jgi:hypothetical protein